jgi:peptide/nickel transport system permease protein
LVDALGPATWEPESDEEVSRVSGSWSLQVARRLIGNRSALVSLAALLVIAILTLFAPALARYAPDAIDPNALNQMPSGSHWFGTDYLGRDLWSRVLYGGRISLPVGLWVVAIEFGIGVPLGLVAGYAGKWTDEALMRLVDVKLALPGLLLPLGLIAILGPSLRSTVIALGVAGIPVYARMARGTTLKVRGQEYIVAAQSVGGRRTSIMVRHVLPNILEPLIVQATIGLGIAILAASALSYLGLGIQPPAADWGTLLYAGYEHMFESWSEIVFPGLAVSLTILAINLVGDGLSDAVNPRLS